MERKEKYRVVPPGFTSEQWKTFNADGIIFIEDAISDEDIQTYIDAIDRVAETNPKYMPGGYLGMQNIVERDPVFAGLIDHECHVGYAYDLFGELLKLHQSQFFLRPPGGKQYNQWHPDGSRALPYGVFSPKLPLQIKIGYWLTESTKGKNGKPRRVTWKPSPAVHGRLRHAQEYTGTESHLSA